MQKSLFNRKIILLLSFIIAFAVFSYSGSAIGISPSRTVFDFKPNMAGSIEFCILNNELKVMAVDLYVKGDLEEYITISENKTSFTASDRHHCFSYDYKLPAELEPGHHDTRIGAVESEATGDITGIGIAARAGVEHQFWIEAPYPGKYITLDVKAPNVQVGQEVPITVAIKNMGKESADITVVIEIYSSGGEKSATLDAGNLSLNPGDSGNLETKWAGSNIAGEYKIAATAQYADKTAAKEIFIKVGDLIIKPTRLMVKQILQGGIQAIPIEVVSFWNEEIKNVRTMAEIGQGATKIASLNTESADFAPWAVKVLNAYWDTTNAALGHYKVKVTVFYANKSSEATFDLEVAEKAAKPAEPISIMPIVLVVVVLIIIIALIIMLKVMFGKDKKRKSSYTMYETED